MPIGAIQSFSPNRVTNSTPLRLSTLNAYVSPQKSENRVQYSSNRAMQSANKTPIRNESSQSMDLFRFVHSSELSEISEISEMNDSHSVSTSSNTPKPFTENRAPSIEASHSMPKNTVQSSASTRVVNNSPLRPSASNAYVSIPNRENRVQFLPNHAVQPVNKTPIRNVTSQSTESPRLIYPFPSFQSPRQNGVPNPNAPSFWDKIEQLNHDNESNNAARTYNSFGFPNDIMPSLHPIQTPEAQRTPYGTPQPHAYTPNRVHSSPNTTVHAFASNRVENPPVADRLSPLYAPIVDHDVNSKRKTPQTPESGIADSDSSDFELDLFSTNPKMPPSQSIPAKMQWSSKAVQLKREPPRAQESVPINDNSSSITGNQQESNHLIESELDLDNLVRNAVEKVIGQNGFDIGHVSNARENLSPITCDEDEDDDRPLTKKRRASDESASSSASGSDSGSGSVKRQRKLSDVSSDTDSTPDTQRDDPTFEPDNEDEERDNEADEDFDYDSDGSQFSRETVAFESRTKSNVKFEAQSDDESSMDSDETIMIDYNDVPEVSEVPEPTSE